MRKTPQLRGFKKLLQPAPVKRDQAPVKRDRDMRAICPGKLAGKNAHKLAIFRAFPLELDMAIFFREQSVIATNTHVYSGMEARAALASDPNSDYLADHFANMMRKKLALLRTVARS